MAKKQEHILFRQTKGRRPASWGLKIKQLMLTKYDDNGKSLGKKFVQYVPGEDSIFKEDHTDDKIPVIPTFENGVLRVHKDDFALLEILKRHPWRNVHFEKIDEEESAKKEIAFQDQMILALEKVNVSGEDELRANGLVLLGQQTLNWGVDRIKASLRKMAIEDPEKVISEMKRVNFRAKYIAALSLLKGVVEEDHSRTAVVWSKTKEPIVRVAVGQSGIVKLGEFLSEDSEKATITLQELGEQIKRSYVVKKPVDIEEEISSFQKQKENVSSQSTEQKGSEDDGETELDELRSQYESKFDKSVPNNKKNDASWIAEKLEE